MNKNSLVKKDASYPDAEIFWEDFFDKIETKFSNQILLKKSIDKADFYQYLGQTFKFKKKRSKRMLLLLANHGYVEVNCIGFKIIKTMKVNDA